MLFRNLNYVLVLQRKLYSHPMPSHLMPAPLCVDNMEPAPFI